MLVATAITLVFNQQLALASATAFFVSEFPRSTIKKIKNLVDPSKTGEIEWFCESQPITNEVKQLWHKAFFHSSTKITILLQV